MFSFIGFGSGKRKRTKKAQKPFRSRKNDDPFSRVSWSFVSPDEFAPWDRAIDRAASSTAVDDRSQGHDSLSYTSKKPLPEKPKDNRESLSQSLPAVLPRSRSESVSEASVAHFASRSFSRHTPSSSRSSHAFDTISSEDHAKPSPKRRNMKMLPPILIPSPSKSSFRKKASGNSDKSASKSRTSIISKVRQNAPVTATDSERGTLSPLSGGSYTLDALPTFDIGKPQSAQVTTDHARKDSATLPNEMDWAILYQKSLLAGETGSISSRKMSPRIPAINEPSQTAKSNSISSSPKERRKAVTRSKSSLTLSSQGGSHTPQLAVGQNRFPTSRVSRITEASSISELTLSDRVSADKMSTKFDRTNVILKWRESTAVGFEDQEEITEVPIYHVPEQSPDERVAPDDHSNRQPPREIAPVEHISRPTSEGNELEKLAVPPSASGPLSALQSQPHQKPEPRSLGIPESATFSSTGTLSILLAQLDVTAPEFPAFREAFGLEVLGLREHACPHPSGDEVTINRGISVNGQSDNGDPVITENDHRKNYPSIELSSVRPEQKLDLLHTTVESKLSDKWSHHRSLSLPEMKHRSSPQCESSNVSTVDVDCSSRHHESRLGELSHMSGRKRSGSAPNPMRVVTDNYASNVPSLIVTSIAEGEEKECEVDHCLVESYEHRVTQQTFPETPSPSLSPPPIGAPAIVRKKLPLQLYIPMDQRITDTQRRLSASPLISPLVPPSPKLFTPSPTTTEGHSIETHVAPLRLRSPGKSHRRPRGPRIRRGDFSSDLSNASQSPYYIIDPPRVTKWRAENTGVLKPDKSRTRHIHELFDHLQEKPMFLTSPVRWRGLKHDSAKLKFTQSELQDITSRAIKQSSDIASIRLLPLNVLDKELPDDLHRLEERKADVISEYTKEVRHRKDLLRSLFSLVSSGSPTSEIEIQLSQRVCDIARSSAYCEDLTDELHDVMDKLMQIQRLQDRHYSSSLAVALRKLHSSFLRQFAELHVLQKYVEELEMWRDAALSQTEQITRELDSFNDRTGQVLSSRRSPAVSFVSKRSSFRSQSNRRSSRRYTARSSSSSLHVNVSTGTRSTFFGSTVPVVPLENKPVYSFDQGELKDDCSVLLSELRTAFFDSESQRLQEELLEMLGTDESVPSRPQSLTIG